MTLTKEQRKHLIYAFGWHADYRDKLNRDDKHKGVTWQDAKRYRDEELAAAGLTGLFNEDYDELLAAELA